ncbi:MAG: hypothetical protein HY343_11370 [Lentisphaerae bacterium]|nr:hypothetical protein [Lentisphaerota bacterium]
MQSESSSDNDITRFPVPIRKLFTAIDGYMDLEMWDTAETEWAALPAEYRASPLGLMLGFRLAAGRKRWPEAMEFARRLHNHAPDTEDAWIRLAYATRRAVNIESARTILLDAQTRFPQASIIWYNLACYECQLGRLDQAEDYLAKACALDRKCLELALTDEDLSPLWTKLKKDE